MKPDLPSIVKVFNFDGEFINIFPYGIGHINDTYAVQYHNSNGSPHRYILQRVNHFVFLNPPGVMQNIEGVTGHLREKILESGGDPQRETLNIIPTVTGDTYYQCSQGNYWRAYTFIEGAHSYETVESLEHAYTSAKTIGNFQRLLGDYPIDDLTETIVDFHHTVKRYQAFIQAVQCDHQNRARLVSDEIDFVNERASETAILVNLHEQGKLPARVTHNDTKFNNVLIDDLTGEGICLVDLDTVMPGLSLYDFGDAVRIAASSAPEDEQDLSKVHLDLDIFEKITHGYLDATRDILAEEELANLTMSAKLMTLECGTRFLTDYLDGDNYFKIHRPYHNLDRCRTQFKLVEDIEGKFDQMEAIVERYK
ncbi:MAG: aminoglycoside phosphotransferase family protein [Anaerolineales bacterium]|nr:aminoglycoside phosphotransferase family protein [Anaerolineales bacterium]